MVGHCAQKREENGGTTDECDMRDDFPLLGDPFQEVTDRVRRKSLRNYRLFFGWGGGGNGKNAQNGLGMADEPNSGQWKEAIKLLQRTRP